MTITITRLVGTPRRLASLAAAVTASLVLLGGVDPASRAHAALLTDVTPGPTVVEVTGVSLDYLVAESDAGPRGNLFLFPGVAVAEGAAAGALLEFAVDFSLADPTADAGGGLLLSDGMAAGLLIGDLQAVGFGEDRLQLLFGDLRGDLASLFPGGALVTIAFDAALGDDPLAALADGTRYAAALSVAPAAIPLPSAALLLVGGLSGLVAVRRRSAIR